MRAPFSFRAPHFVTVARALTRVLARRGVRHLALAPGQDKNRLVTLGPIAAQYGLRRISDLAKYLPAAG